MAILQSFLSAPAYSVGERCALQALREKEGASPEVLLNFHDRGHRLYCQQSGSFTELCCSSALQTLQDAKVEPEAVELVVFANSNADWSLADELELLNALAKAGIRRGKIIGLQLQNCSALGAALDVSKALLPDDAPSRALVILCGYVKRGQSRLSLSNQTVYGDGAATCIVSNRPAGWQILATAASINPSLASSASPSQIVRSRYRDLQQHIDQAYRCAGIAASDITALLGTSGNNLYFQLLAEAAGIPARKVYTDDLAKFGHLFSCDNLIALKNYSSSKGVHAGDHLLVVGWSPYAVGVAILRSIGAC